MEESILKIRIELLENALRLVQEELEEANMYLDKMNVPTNGVDANGVVGYGKRENLTLKQRLTYVQKMNSNL